MESLWGGHGKARKTVNLGSLFKLLLSPHITIVFLPYSARVWNDLHLHPVYLLPFWSRAVKQPGTDHISRKPVINKGT